MIKSGIYKITNPNNRIYIGQSVNIEKRFRRYKSLDCKRQPRIYNSLVKYGVDKHKFEILIECDESDLNKYEKYYQELFCVTNKNGLNCGIITGECRKFRHSDESRKKISEAGRNRRHTEETKMRFREIALDRKYTEETKLKFAENARKNKNRSKKVINLETGEIFPSAEECGKAIGVSGRILRQRMSRNKSYIFKYVCDTI